MSMTSEPLPFSLQEKLEALKVALLAQNPAFTSALSVIHAETKKHPEYVYALSDEQFATIVEGYSRHTQITSDGGKVSRKQAALLNEDDI